MSAKQRISALMSMEEGEVITKKEIITTDTDDIRVAVEDFMNECVIKDCKSISIDIRPYAEKEK